MKKRIVVLCSICLSVIGGCKSSTSVIPSGPRWAVPGVGSYFIDSNVVKSTSGSKVSFDTVQVTWRGSIDGKSSVVKLSTGFYFAYESNGDMSSGTFNQTTGMYDWKRSPTGGGEEIDSSVQGRIVAIKSISYLGQEIIPLRFGSPSAIKIRETHSQVRSDSLGHSITDTLSTQDVWVVPSLGWIGKMLFTLSNSSTYFELIKYELH